MLSGLHTTTYGATNPQFRATRAPSASLGTLQFALLDRFLREAPVSGNERQEAAREAELIRAGYCGSAISVEMYYRAIHPLDTQATLIRLLIAFASAHLRTPFVFRRRGIPKNARVT